MRSNNASKKIEMLSDIQDIVPVLQVGFDNCPVKVVDRQKFPCKNYLSPNRRQFYMIIMFTGSKGIFTLGLNTYYIDKSMIFFVHPNDIISWQNMQETQSGYYVLFKKDYIEKHPTFKSTIEKLGVYSDKTKRGIIVEDEYLPRLNSIWKDLEEEESREVSFANESIQAYLQLIVIESCRIAKFSEPDAVTEDFTHIHRFFNLLEEETANINYENPIRLKTAKEFAHSLAVHPNHLNSLVKKHTGQNLSTHIKNRILEESKVMLLQTMWSLQEISYAVGFADQPNFNFFFKKNTGITPHEFRRANSSVN
ncbi:AraC family transcriptional regulator [Flavobacterium terrisoli]|uniref:AraC family transcriptional regulator n=1 Tax=Flavobacterium terrisoli TaxID=3242195 RepID=UPI002542FABD|nr:helix-turn-helix domain-containing protein [Flavobacterium buctense]